jgi:hypothetical protein
VPTRLKRAHIPLTALAKSHNSARAFCLCFKLSKIKVPQLDCDVQHWGNLPVMKRVVKRKCGAWCTRSSGIEVFRNLGITNRATKFSGLLNTGARGRHDAVCAIQAVRQVQAANVTDDDNLMVDKLIFIRSGWQQGHSGSVEKGGRNVRIAYSISNRRLHHH